HLHAAAQVAVHPVGRADIDLRLAGVVEVKHAAVLQEAIDDRRDSNVFADSFESGPQRTDSAADKIDSHPRLAGSIEGLHNGRLQKAVDLGDDSARFAGKLIGGLLLNLLEHERLQAAWGDDQLLPLRQFAIAGEIVEERGGVVAKIGIASKETQIGVN